MAPDNATGATNMAKKPTPEALANQIAAEWKNPAAVQQLLKGHAELVSRAGQDYADAELARMLKRAKALVRSEVRRGIRRA